jgi:hypothetical protein
MVTYPQLPFDCDFEIFFCTWQSDFSADIQWLRHTGATPTEATGPQIDHTTLTPFGYYIYVKVK